MGRFLNFLTVLFLLTSCQAEPTSSSIHRYEYSEVESKMISYLDVFNVSETNYYLYYYQVDCYHCHGIKSKVISFALSNEEPFYFVEVKEDYGFISRTKEDTIGTNDPLKAFALMTPQLSYVRDGIISGTYIGDEEILNIIE